MLSASNIPTPNHSSDYSEPTTLLLLPAFAIIENVTPASVPTLISDYVDRAPTNTSALAPVSAAIPASLPPPDLPEPAAKLHGLRSRPCPHSVIILLCSQKTRDARCGQSAPLISKEMQRVTNPLFPLLVSCARVSNHILTSVGSTCGRSAYTATWTTRGPAAWASTSSRTWAGTSTAQTS